MTANIGNKFGQQHYASVKCLLHTTGRAEVLLFLVMFSIRLKQV